MSKFRKKPIVIEAYQTTYPKPIETLEGTMMANPGDWIITGVNGEQYPCKPDIFAKSYDPVDATPPPAPVDEAGLRAAERPTIVCLCGSTRFAKEFADANLRETLAGRIVLTIGCNMRDDDLFAALDPEELRRIKIALDALHFRKIELADEILVLNVGGYIGDSTRNEIRHAQSLGKRVRWLESDAIAAALAARTGETE